MHVIASFCTCFILNVTSAQDKENEAKKETIGYLNQKTKEIIGFNKLAVSQKVFLNKRTITDGHLKQTNSGVEIFVVYTTPTYSMYTYNSFNPKHIVSITNSSAESLAPDSPVGTLEIKLVGKTAIFNNNGDSSNVQKVILNFLQADPGNEGRIVKALLRLRDLFKTEDAMFED